MSKLVWNHYSEVKRFRYLTSLRTALTAPSVFFYLGALKGRPMNLVLNKNVASVCAQREIGASLVLPFLQRHCRGEKL